MNFNTTGNDYAGPNILQPYISIDPKYICLEDYLCRSKYIPNDSYIDSSLLAGANRFDHFMRQRQGLVSYKIQMLYSQIYDRRKIKEENLYRINLDQCSFKNIIFSLGDDIWDQRRLELERRIIELEEEKRREETGYFRDLLFIRKDLRQVLLEKQEEDQRAGLLMSQKEGLQCTV